MTASWHYPEELWASELIPVTEVLRTRYAHGEFVTARPEAEVGCVGKQPPDAILILNP